MGELGIGLVGCGNISTTYLRLAPIFRGYEIRAVADRDESVAREQAARHGVRHDTVDDLLSADDIDLVVNLTVPAAHFEISSRILEAGKHCYSEKPFALTLAEGAALCELAERAGVRIGSAPDTFLGGAHQEAQALLDAGASGAVVGGTAHVMSRGMEHWHPGPDFFYRAGGGPVLDLGPYYITDLVHLIGPVRAVSAMASTSFPVRTIASGPRAGEEIPVDTPTNVHALLEFENGAIVTFGASWGVLRHGHPVMELYGSDGTLAVPDPNMFGGSIGLSINGAAMQDKSADHHPFARPNDAPGAARANYRGAGLADMVLAIAEGRPHRCDGELALHVTEVLTGILESAERGAAMRMTTRCGRPDPLPPDAARRLLRDTGSG